jgi:hypothetical protein
MEGTPVDTVILALDGRDSERALPAAEELAHPATIISRAAQRHQAGTIVVAGRHHHRLAGMVSSSVSQRLLAQAPCPVLIVTPETTRETFRAINRPTPAAA